MKLIHTFDLCHLFLHMKTLCVCPWVMFVERSNTYKIYNTNLKYVKQYRTALCYHDWVTLLGIVVIASQYWSMNGMISMSLLNIYFNFPSFAADCCKLAMAVVHIWEIAKCKQRYALNVKLLFTRLTYWLDFSGSFLIQLENNFCTQKSNWLRMVLVFPVETRCKTHETTGYM